MPISEDDWNKGQLQDRLKPEILDFLQQEKPNAFTDMEILDYLKQFSGEPWGGFLTGIGSLFPVQNALRELVAEGKIESKTIASEGSSPAQYYRAR